MSVTPEEVTEQSQAGPGFALASFYERRAPAALAYCARVCPPEAVTGAMEASFARALADGVPAAPAEPGARWGPRRRAGAPDRSVPPAGAAGRRRFARGSV